MVISEINVSDGRIIKLKISSDMALVMISDWQETIYTIIFKGIVGIEVYSPENIDLSHIEISNQSERIEKVCHMVEADTTDITEYSFISAWNSLSLLNVFCEIVEVTIVD